MSAQGERPAGVPERRAVSSGSPYEAPIGFARAVRISHQIAVSGTAPLGPDGRTVAPGDAYGQTKRCLEIIAAAVEALGGTMAGVLRTRVYLTDARRWEEAGRAHGEAFPEHRPACPFVEVKGLLDPDWLVEIEADAVVA